jgi:hypothetical protein
VACGLCLTRGSGALVSPDAVDICKCGTTSTGDARERRADVNKNTGRIRAKGIYEERHSNRIIITTRKQRDDYTRSDGKGGKTITKLAEEKTKSAILNNVCLYQRCTAALVAGPNYETLHELLHMRQSLSAERPPSFAEPSTGPAEACSAANRLIRRMRLSSATMTLSLPSSATAHGPANCAACGAPSCLPVAPDPANVRSRPVASDRMRMRRLRLSACTTTTGIHTE